jgi:pyridoxamine 5'-phosphate oxidase-like protein
MSIPVTLEKLREEIAGFTTTAVYLLTVSGDGRPHSVAVAPEWDGDELVMGAGKTSVGNAAARPDVSLVWAPGEAGGYSLIVDATVTSTLLGDGDSSVTVQPTSAVLHRPAASPDSMRPGCTSDCIPIRLA